MATRYSFSPSSHSVDKKDGLPIPTSAKIFLIVIFKIWRYLLVKIRTFFEENPDEA